MERRTQQATQKETRPKYMDMHMHTNYSDGVSVSPRQLVSTCALRGMDLIAITDHDSFRGYEEAKRAGDDFGITVLPGTEITTPNYHLLALNFNPYDKKFNQFIAHSRELQEKTCERRIELLRDVGIPITLRKVKRIFPESRLGKVNIIVAMTQDQGCRAYMQEKHPEMTPRQVQYHYMGDGGIASGIDKYGVTEPEAIDAVHRAGGLIGVAHAVKDIPDIDALPKRALGFIPELDELLNKGIDFVEVQPALGLMGKYLYQTVMVSEWIKNNNLPIVYGSDYHGPVITDRELLKRDDNILSENTRDMLNRGYQQID